MAKPDYVGLGKQLKKLGLIDFDLRKLSPGAKARITVLSKEFKSELNNPDRYAVRNISKARANQLAEVGHAVWKTKSGKYKTAIRTPSSDSTVKIKRNSIVTMDHENGIMYRDILSNLDIIAQAKNLEHRLIPGQTLTVRIGGHSPFRKSYSPGALQGYMANWVPKPEYQNESLKSRKARGKKLRAQMSIVTVLDEDMDYE